MITRKIEKKLTEALKNFKIVMLNGSRQSGKTTLVKLMAQDQNMDYITLDDPDKLTLSKTDPKNLLS